MPDQVLPKSRRRWFRSSMRGLMALVLVVGIGLGWMVVSANTQRDAVAAIEKSRGRVAYDWDSINGREIVRGTPWAPRWLVDRIGVDFFGHVTAVWIN